MYVNENMFSFCFTMCSGNSVLTTDQTAYLSNNQDGHHTIRCHKAC